MCSVQWQAARVPAYRQSRPRDVRACVHCWRPLHEPRGAFRILREHKMVERTIAVEVLGKNRLVILLVIYRQGFRHDSSPIAR